MRCTWRVILALALASRAQAQGTNAPARLAVVPESAEFATVADLLTVELSAKPHLHLLERSQIEKVYREQQVSAVNRDDVRLGQVLGAEGLLLLEAIAEGTNAFVGARLVAVRPGVIIGSVRAPWPVPDPAGWARWIASHFAPLLPKLEVSAKGAIPVSVVNIRSAIDSADAQELERQLAVLLVERLSRERELFVLERRQMDLLSAEKELRSAAESAFWNGSYLLDGVIDRDAYARDTATVHAQLTPPMGGRPVSLEIRGPRAAPAEVVEAMVGRVLESLKLEPAKAAWSPEEEAARFLDEAQWALQWDMLPEAQTAADAAWALGKRDLQCAALRVRARSAQVPIVLPPGHAMSKHGRRIHSVALDDPPDARFCRVAAHALECYLQFCRMSPEGEPKVLPEGSARKGAPAPDWYRVGIEALEAASRVLQHFYHSPALVPAAADTLADLRAQTRAVAQRVFDAPSVRDSYFVGTRIATHDELAHTIAEDPNVFSCMLEWGCFWQERPEETLALYRKLLESPVFCYIHHRFWERDPIRPRLAAWRDEDRRRIPGLWAAFVDELNASTNLLWRMEAKALAKSDAKDPALAEKARQEWWSLVRSNRAELVGNNVELFYLGWRFDHNAEIDAMGREYWEKTIPAARTAGAFDAQKTFLRENQPYQFTEFNQLFRGKTYTQAQALELLPLIVAYRSNLLAKAQLADPPQRGRMEHDARSVEVFLQRAVERMAHPETQPQPPPAQPSTARSAPQPVRPAAPPATREAARGAAAATAMTPATTTNVLTVRKFLEIPLEELSQDTIASVDITAYHRLPGTLLLDVQLGRAVHSHDAQGQWNGTRYASIPAVAILDTASERWHVVQGEETDVLRRNPFYHRTTLWRGSVFTSQGGKVRKYPVSRKTWVDPQLPDLGHCELFTVHDQLIAATHEMIAEILGDGAGLRILASNRRQPPASALDGEALGTPAVFGGPGGTLRVAAAQKILSWDGADWVLVCPAPAASRTPWVSDRTIVFFGDGWNTAAGVWRLSAGSDQLECCLVQARAADRPAFNARPSVQPKPLWTLPPGLTLARLPVADRDPGLLLMVDHSKAETIVDRQNAVITGTRVLPQDGYHAALLCFSTDGASPRQVNLAFADIGAAPPVSGDPGGRRFVPTEGPAEWLCVGDGQLYMGRQAPNRPATGGRRGPLPKPGVWVISLEQIDRELDRQKQAQGQGPAP